VAPLGKIVIATAAAAFALAGAAPALAAPAEGIHKIQHVVIIMQENRSYDTYFGTYPGANGIPAGVCVPDPSRGGCVKPFYDGEAKNAGGPHGAAAAAVTIAGTGFAPGASATVVKFGSTAASAVQCSSLTKCTATATAHKARSIDVKAVVAGQTSPLSAADRFTYE
jgi:hypothetical protein